MKTKEISAVEFLRREEAKKKKITERARKMEQAFLSSPAFQNSLSGACYRFSVALNEFFTEFKKVLREDFHFIKKLFRSKKKYD